MKALRVVLLAALAWLLTVPAYAAEMELVGVSGTEKLGGEYAGLYTLTADGDTLLAMCDDFNTQISIGLTWTAHRYTYGDIMANSSLVKFGRRRYRYNQAGWLMSLLDGGSSVHQRAVTNAAIWKIMTPSITTYDLNSEVMALYNSARDGTHDSFDFSHVMVVWTPDPKTASQEFLQPVPAPATVLLFLTGIGVLLLVRRRA